MGKGSNSSMRACSETAASVSTPGGFDFFPRQASQPNIPKAATRATLQNEPTLTENLPSKTKIQRSLELKTGLQKNLALE
jgi:hypothetical protein